MDIDSVELNNQGIMLAQKGNLVMARDKFMKTIELDPMFFEGYRNLGVINTQIGNYTDAKINLKKALLIKKDGEAYFQYGTACVLNKETKEGIEYYNMALSLGYDGAEALFYIGMAYEEIHDYLMALRYYRKAIIKDPIHADYQLKEINVLIRMKKFNDAENAINKLIDTNPELYEAYHVKNTFLISQKRIDEAKEQSRLAAERYPEDVELLMDYVNALILSEEYDIAQDLLANAKRLKYYKEFISEMMLLSIELLAKKNEIDKALTECDSFILSIRDTKLVNRVKYIKMNLLIAKHTYDSAYELAKEFSKNEDEKPYYFGSLYYLGFCLKEMGRVDESQIAFNEAISVYRMWTVLHPDSLDVYIYRAMCLIELGKYDSAMEMLEFVEGVNDEIAEINILKAEIYKSTGCKQLVKEDAERTYSLIQDFSHEIYDEEEK